MKSLYSVMAKLGFDISDRIERDFSIHNERLVEYLHDRELLDRPINGFYHNRTVKNVSQLKIVFERVWSNFYRRKDYPTHYAFHDEIIALV